MMDLTNKTELLNYLKMNGLWAKKGLGQNFLVNRNALDKIVGAAELLKDDLVIEVGPGVGTLTQELVQHAGEVVAVEMDEKLAELLKQQLCHSRSSRESTIVDPRAPLSSYIAGPEDDKEKSGMTTGTVGMTTQGTLKIVNDDILKVDLNKVIGGRPYKVVANIPYYITSKILELFLSRENKPELIVLLVQKEVAERICAKPGEMSVLAVSVQLYGQPEIVDIVKKESFFPSPKVDSAILKVAISCHSEVSTEESQRSFASHTQPSSGSRDDSNMSDELFDEKSLFRCVHIGFAAKRKTLVNNLMVGYQLERDKVLDILKKMGLKETVRAQELSVEEWKELVKQINC